MGIPMCKGIGLAHASDSAVGTVEVYKQAETWFSVEENRDARILYQNIVGAAAI